MAAFYQQFISTRTTEPQWETLVAQLRAIDVSIGLQHQPGSQNYTLKKNSIWLAGQITNAQNVIDNAPAYTTQLQTQVQVDQLTLLDKAIILTILDQFNTIRALLVPPLPPITQQQMIAAIRSKAGTLS